MEDDVEFAFPESCKILLILSKNAHHLLIGGKCLGSLRHPEPAKRGRGISPTLAGHTN